MISKDIIRFETDVAIIGGGLAGASAALFLRKKKLSVILLEKAYCGAQASGVNYGGVRRQGRAPIQMPLSQYAYDIWQRLTELIHTDGEYQQSGHLKLACTEADFERLQQYARSVSDFPLNLQLFDKNDVKRHFPWLQGNVSGASFCPKDGQANPRLVSPAFASAAKLSGAQIFELSSVIEATHNGHCFTIKTNNGLEIRSQFLVNAAGAWSNTIAKWFGENVPLTNIYPNMIVTEPVAMQLPVSLGQEGGGFYCRQVSRGNFVAGGGRGKALDNTDYSRPVADNMIALMRNISELFPMMSNAAVIRSWTGTEGETSDHQPVIGFSQTTPNLLHAFGFSGAGFQIAPAVGAVISDLIKYNKTEIDVKPFNIGRFII